MVISLYVCVCCGIVCMHCVHVCVFCLYANVCVFMPGWVHVPLTDLDMLHMPTVCAL